MDVTEALPGTLADAAEQDPDGFYATGWAARTDLPDAVVAALPDVMRRRLVETVDLGHKLAIAERDLAAALAMAHRYQTAVLRLDVENRALREKVADLESARVGPLRHWWRSLGAPPPEACVCLAAPRRSL